MAAGRKLIPSALHLMKEFAVLLALVHFPISVSGAVTSKRFRSYSGFVPDLISVEGGAPLTTVENSRHARHCAQLCVGEEACGVAVFTPSTKTCVMYASTTLYKADSPVEATMLVDILSVHVSEPGELGFWPLTLATGLNDLSLQGRHGTSLHEVTFDAHGAVFPQGFNARFQIAAYPDPVTSFSWHGRVYVEAASMTGPLFAWHTGTHIWLWQGMFHIMVVYSGCATITFNSPTLAIGQWYTFSMTYSYAETKVTAYVDGTEYVTDGAACTESVSATGDIYIGTTLGANSNWGNFYGKVACMGYYNHVVPDIANIAQDRVDHYCAHN